MGLEIERKFLLDEAPAAERLGEGTHIRQGYLAEDEAVSVRLRIMDAQCVITIKAGGGLARTEVEMTIPRDDAESLWTFTEGRRLEKTRYRLAVGADTAEVDLFSGALNGLSLVEVEFDSEDAANSFEPPSWFGRELTHERRWSNASLARLGRPEDE